uniref:Uncharacterized protein n=1 Tax=Globodera rostochiensis TaxID=31243 RepID=A0A914HFP6_GLORO
MISERPTFSLPSHNGHQPNHTFNGTNIMAENDQESGNTTTTPTRSSNSAGGSAENNVTTEQKRMFRFLHSALAIVSILWATVCLLIYFHAPSSQSQQLFDCRWHLAAILVQASFGHVFVFCSRSALLFCASFLSTQYAIVYSLLTLVIYSLDTALLMLFPRPPGVGMDFGPYLKLTAVFIVLSAFGLGLSLAHMRKLLQTGKALAKHGETTTTFTTFAGLNNQRTLRALTGCQAGLSLLSIYVAASLTPMKFWYVRTHIVQEFSCSLLATSLAVMQFLVFRLANGGGPLLIKGIVLANACQIVQELNMALSAFYTFFYVGRIYDAVEERTSFFTGQESVHVQLALARVQHTKTVLALSLLFHIGRMLLNAFVLLSLAPRVFDTALTFRVKFKLDSEMVQSDQQWTQTRKRESKWLYSVSACVLAVAAGHVLLNFGYIWESMIFESLSVATGLSFVFSICLLGAVGFYAFRLLRFCLILSAYISLNLLVTAALLLFAFIQDFFFLATTLDDDKDTIMTTLNTSSSLFRGSVGDRNDSLTMDDSDANGGDSTLKILLYLADFALSVGTFFIAAFTLRYAVSTLVKTKLLQTQPAGVQRAVRLLRALSIVGIVSAAIEFLLLAELRIGKTATMSHLSVNSSFYDWLLTSAQFVFLFYVTRFERYQALLPVQILQLASVAITTLDLIGQQTDIVQIYVNSVLQFYRVTEALFRRPVLSEGSASAVFVTHTSSLAIPLHLFVDILALHFLQIAQWFLTICALGIALYCADNMVADESESSNDFHELRNSGGAQIQAEQRNEESPPPPCPTSSTPPPMLKMVQSNGNGNVQQQRHFNNAAFENQLYNMEELESNISVDFEGKKAPEAIAQEKHNGRPGHRFAASIESSPYKDINLNRLPDILSNFGLPDILSNFGLPDILSNFALPDILSNFGLPDILSNFGLPDISSVGPFGWHRRAVLPEHIKWTGNGKF